MTSLVVIEQMQIDNIPEKCRHESKHFNFIQLSVIEQVNKSIFIDLINVIAFEAFRI